MKYIIELEPGVWFSNVDGDPGRTLVRANAKRFQFRRWAESALRKARKYRPFKNAQILRDAR